jgi:hypothetical protein
MQASVSGFRGTGQRILPRQSAYACAGQRNTALLEGKRRAMSRILCLYPYLTALQFGMARTEAGTVELVDAAKCLLIACRLRRSEGLMD